MRVVERNIFIGPPGWGAAAWEAGMSVAKVVEITATSGKSIEDAIEKGVARASETLEDVQGAWVQDVKVDVADGKVVAWRVSLKVTFVLK